MNLEKLESIAKDRTPEQIKRYKEERRRLRNQTLKELEKRLYMKKFRKLVFQDFNTYSAYIQYKTWYGWITIKYLESDDLDYLQLCADEILEKLNETI